MTSSTTYKDQKATSPSFANVTVGEMVSVQGTTASGVVTATSVTIGFGGGMWGHGRGPGPPQRGRPASQEQTQGHRRPIWAAGGPFSRANPALFEFPRPGKGTPNHRLCVAAEQCEFARRILQIPSPLCARCQEALRILF